MSIENKNILVINHQIAGSFIKMPHFCPTYFLCKETATALTILILPFFPAFSRTAE